MQKKYTTGKKGLVDEIESRAHTNPFPLELQDSNEEDVECPKVSNQLLLHFYMNRLGLLGALTSNKKFRTSLTNRAMDAMIDDLVWDDDLANAYQISREELEYHNSLKIHLHRFVNQELEDEWKSIVQNKSKVCFEEELNKAIKYREGKNNAFEENNKGLRGLLASGRYEKEHTTPRIMVENQLFGKSDAIMQFHNEFRLLEAMRNAGEISISTYKEEERKKQAALKAYLRDKRRLFGELFNDEESNVNYIYIRAIGNRIYGTETTTIPTLNVTSVRHGKDLIDQYVKWYNAKHILEILASQKQQKKQSDKERYQRLNSDKKDQRDATKQSQLAELLGLMSEGYSLNKAAEQTGVKRSTAQRWVKENKSKAPDNQ